MDASPIPFYRLEFARRAEWRRDEDERRLHREKHFKDRKEKEEREKREDAQADAADAVAAAVFASDENITEFRAQIDVYDAATVEALHLNEIKLVKVEKELREMLEQAYVLPDGRRVFKTEDGLRVFDEDGNEVEDFDPDEIEEWRTSWEKFDDVRQEQIELLEERAALHEYQGLLDDTREALDQEGLTEEELEGLKKRLEENKPDAVKRVLGEDATPAPDPRPDFDPATLNVRPMTDMAPS